MPPPKLFRKHYLRFVVGDPSAIGPITTVLERNGVNVARAAAVWAKGESADHQVRASTFDLKSRTAIERHYGTSLC